MLQTKAIYMLLRLNAAEDPAVTADPWALEDLRILPLDAVFARLEKYGLPFDRKTFHHFAADCETPEELADLLLPDGASEKQRDPFYLIVFELWRRLLPEKQSLSIFCDELDHRIALYDQGEAGSDELVQEGLGNLLEVLDENADAGADPEEVFLAICDYCAHDLESFFYDYIADLLDGGHSLYASELIEGFSPYVNDPLWFDFLRVRLLSFTDVGDANLALYRLLENELDFALLVEMLRFLVSGERELFAQAIQKALPFLTAHEEWLEVMEIAADFYRRLGEDEKAEAIQQAMRSKAPGAAVHPSDLSLLFELFDLH